MNVFTGRGPYRFIIILIMNLPITCAGYFSSLVRNRGYVTMSGP